MHAPNFDICECGDYRYMHEDLEKCGLPVPCTGFRIFKYMIPTWRVVTEQEKAAAERG